MPSPPIQATVSDKQEEFPALPSAAPESATSTRPPPPPPVITKPPPAPPMIRKANVPAKTTAKASATSETKKPTLPPLATTLLTKGKEKEGAESAKESPITEAPSAKSEKGKKAFKEKENESAVNTPVTPAPPVQNAKVGKQEPANKTTSKKDKEAKNSASSTPILPAPPSEPVEHAPILARQTKKSKPQQLPKKKHISVKEDTSVQKENTPEPPVALPCVEVSTGALMSLAAGNLRHLFGQLNEQRELRTFQFFNTKTASFREGEDPRSLPEALATVAHATAGTAEVSTENLVVAFSQLHDLMFSRVSELRDAMPNKWLVENKALITLIGDLKEAKVKIDEDSFREQPLVKQAQWMLVHCE